MPEITIDQAIALAIQHQQAGRLTEAEELCRQILGLQPNHADALHLAGVLAGQRGQLQMAVDLLHRAVALLPAAAEYRFNLAVALSDMGWLDRAIAELREVVRLVPDHLSAWINLGNLLALHGRLDDAAAACLKAIELDPRNATAHNNLGNLRKEQGLLDDALASYDRAMALQPAEPMFHSNRVYTLHFHPGYDASSIHAEHLEWNERHAARLSSAPAAHWPGSKQRKLPSGGRLKIGYVSPNFRTHPVGRFLLPLLREHDHAQFEISCYSDVRRPDALTEKLRRLADTWRDTTRFSDEQLAECIRRDEIDILVDLTMHMVDNRLLVFARKPAPVQVTYLAYCSTTGLDAMDYRLTDPYLDPSPLGIDVYSETSICLPKTYWCYEPGMVTPDVASLPALANGYVTFGCLNTFSKVSEAALAYWCRILREVPNSRLLLHAKEGSHRNRVFDFLKQAGVDPNRLSFVGFTPGEDYFRLYHGIDIALDPFPCAGGTTTCDAMWMGVPVITLSGATAVSRAGVSILSNLALAEFVARSPEDYIRHAVGLAADVRRLAALRDGLRRRVLQSPLTDAPRFARDVEDAYRRMWTG